MKLHSLSLAALALSSLPFLAAQPADDTRLVQAIVFGRHSVRSGVAPDSLTDLYAVQQYPDFGVQPGILTPHGEAAETILGGYYRLWLAQQNLLTGDDAADAANVYIRASTIQRTIDTAQHFALGLLPAANVNVFTYGLNGIDPLFEPFAAGVATLDQEKAMAAVLGRLGGDASSLAIAYGPELDLLRSVLLRYPGREGMLPAPPTTALDVTQIPFSVGPGASGASVSLGGLTTVSLTLDPFIMQYAAGMPLAEVGWGEVDPETINQASRLYALDLDLQCKTPYLDSVQSSNLASHIVRSFSQAATRSTVTGALGLPSTKLIVVIASDSDVAGFAGLFHLDWILPGYLPDFCSPGGALVFELRQSQSSGQYIVRTSYISQTLDQLRNLTPLTLAAPPAIAPVFIPGCSTANATFDCPLTTLLEVAQQVIDPHSASLFN